MTQKRKKIRLRYTKERVVISDVLPYELPIIFSNRHFYRFLVYYGVEYRNNNICWNINGRKLNSNEQAALPLLIELLAGCKKGCSDLVKSITPIDIHNTWRTPFVYKINHKEKDFRELAIIHPKNQLEIIYLYDKYKELILYYSSLSRFSIRKPSDVAKYVYYKDKLHRQNKGHKLDSIEVYHSEYENLKTYFTYKKYTNIYRFYEDYRYQRAEKKYNNLVKFDISKCFDSIYTHSLVWAILGKNIVKDNLGLSSKTFAGEFDSYMQSINYGETNGILIGPEFSRIFAELIFQKIDKTVETKLASLKNPIHLYKDYECYRYVDDFFLFYNDERIKDEIMTAFRLELKEFKMGLSDSKTIYYSKPIVTDITMAKLKVIELLDENIKFKIEEAERDIPIDEDDETKDPELTDKFTLFINPNKIAARFKVILKECNVGYKDVLNYTLAILSRKIETIIKKFDKKFREYTQKETDGTLTIDEKKKKYNLEKRFTAFIINLLDYIFFMYTVHPKVNSTIKLSVILDSIVTYYKGRYFFEGKAVKRFSAINRDLVFKKIQDEVRLVLEKTKLQEHSQMETLFLLIILKELGGEYLLPEAVIAEYFCIHEEATESEPHLLKCVENINSLTICVLLYYIANRPEYKHLKDTVLKHTIGRVSKVDENKRRNNTELTILLFDILSCPFVDVDFKKKMLTLFEIVSPKEQDDILAFHNKQQYWFIKWKDVNLNKELNAKISLEVYS